MKLRKPEKPKFHWGTVGVFETSTNEFVMVKAQILGDTGLCVNQYDPLKPAGKFVSVTHIPTGKRLVNSFNSARSARWFCLAAAELMDWNKLKGDKDLPIKYPGVGTRLIELRTLIVSHGVDWKKELVVRLLTGEGGT